MSKKKKQESKKERKKRIKRNQIKVHIHNKKIRDRNSLKMPESFEEAVKMGILR